MFKLFALSPKNASAFNVRRARLKMISQDVDEPEKTTLLRAEDSIVTRSLFS